MENRTRASLIKALSYCSLRELPEKDNGEDVWIKALALVTKSDGNDYYVNVEKDAETLVNRVKKDFGPTGAIVKYKEIYPYLYLSSEYMPKFSDKSKETKVKYLEERLPDVNWAKRSTKDINDAIIGLAIAAQLRDAITNFYYTEAEEYEQDDIETEVGGDESEAQVDM